MGDDSVKIEFVEGQAVTPRRGIAWITGKNKDLNGKNIFDGLNEEHHLFLMASMKAWIDGAPDIPRRFHGFPGDPSFKDGFVFKWRNERVQQRLYGFKIRPGIPDGRFEVCALAMYDTKDTQETDSWIKNTIVGFRDDRAIRTAIAEQVKKIFETEHKKGSTNT